MKTRSKKLVYGVGINDADKFTKSNVLRLALARWKEILRRCYSEDYHLRNPSYKGCCVCEEWHTFSNFLKWFEVNHIEGYAIDKDLLVKGNKKYSPNTCCFVPKAINNLITNCYRKRGKYPIGVTKYKGDDFFVVKLRKNKRECYIGCFKKEYDAFCAYKIAKEAYIKQVAKDNYHKGFISQNVYNALMNYQINFTD